MGRLVAQQGLMFIVLCLQGCALALSSLGASTATVQVATAVDAVKTGADIVSYGTTDKTLTDHAISNIIGKDCKTFNVIQGKHICRVHHTYYVRWGHYIRKQHEQTL